MKWQLYSVFCEKRIHVYSYCWGLLRNSESGRRLVLVVPI
jgi:hypothetical protein